MASPEIVKSTSLISASANEALFQKYFILATGSAATNPGIAWLDTQVKPNGDMSEVGKVIDAYMGNIEKAVGRDGALQMVIKNGLGAAISAADAKAINAELAANKISNWSQIFNLAANLKNILGDTLNAKAQAASSFAATLDAAGKVDFYAGEAVVNAVKVLLQGTTSSAASLASAKSALTALSEALSVSGIQAAVVDGYIAGAAVFVDQNNDGKANAGEWSGTTDAKGFYVLPATVSGAKITASGGKDILTQKDFVGVLSAPAGSTVMNPITTLVQTVLESNPNALVSDAKSLVSTALGIPESINPLSYDPIKVLSSPSASASEKAAALDVQSSAIQVTNTMTQMASVLANAAGSSADRGQAANLVAKAIVSSLQKAATAEPGKAFDLTKAENIAAVLTTAATEAKATSVVAKAAEFAAVTVAANAAAEKATSIEALAKAAVVAQDSVAALVTASKTGDLASVTANFTGKAFDQAVTNAKVGELAPGIAVPPPETPAPTVAPTPAPTPGPAPIPTPEPRPEPPDTTPPTLTITSSKDKLKAGETATITFSFSEDPGSSFSWNGTIGDVSVSNGSLAAISGSGLTRTAIFTPSANFSGGQANISVAAGSYFDGAGNAGGAGASPSIYVDTIAPLSPVTGLLSVGNAPFDSINETEQISLTIQGSTGAVESGGVVNIEITGANNQRIVINGLQSEQSANGAFNYVTGLSGFSDGNVTFRFTVGDRVGNIDPGNVSTITATLDATPPSVTLARVDIVDNFSNGVRTETINNASIQYGPTGVLGSSEYTSSGVTGVFKTDDSAPTVIVTGISGSTDPQDIVAVYGGPTGLPTLPALTPSNLLATGLISSDALEFAQLNIGRTFTGGTASPGPYVFVIRIEDLAGNLGTAPAVAVEIELTGVLGGGG